MKRIDESKKPVILECVNDYFGRYNRAPSVREIAAETGFSLSTVHRYLKSMQESGILTYDGIRSIETKRTEKDAPFRSIPVLGSVTCGPGDYEEENIREYIRMPESMVGKGDLFALYAKGESMVDAGISPGDCVIVRKQNTAEKEDIVVALYDGGLNSLKKLKYDSKKRRYCLFSCNKNQDKYPPIYFDELAIQGVAVCTVHNLGKLA